MQLVITFTDTPTVKANKSNVIPFQINLKKWHAKMTLLITHTLGSWAYVNNIHSNSSHECAITKSG